MTDYALSQYTKFNNGVSEVNVIMIYLYPNGFLRIINRKLERTHINPVKYSLTTKLIGMPYEECLMTSWPL